jgi:AraC-like DNA-binding protein
MFGPRCSQQRKRDQVRDEARWQDRCMSTTTDTFTRFVNVLADSLDDHETSGETLAARLHLSRFHFDRLVTAAGGEPPATLRRRILLERAAYRLITTGDELLPIALDAGYSSHEAFTRAFRRAYGQSPSRWRRQPTQFRLEAPSKVHFNPPGGLRLPAQRKVTPMELLTRMVEHNVWLVGEMIERAGDLPDDVLDARIELSVEDLDDQPTLRSQLSRLVGQMAMWNAAIDARAYDFAIEDDESISDLRARLADEGPAFLKHVQTIVEEGRLDETFVDAICDPPEVFTYGGMIAHVLTFAAHRRTLVCGALIEAGISDLGAGDPMRWVAQPA